MKNKKILILSIIVNLVFLLIICILISGDKNIIRGKQLVKEMTQSENETNLQTQINTLNASHTDYANSIEESKKKIASAITEKGVETSSDVTLDTMAENIKNISIDKDNGEISQSIIDYIYYRTANKTQITSWQDLFSGYISSSPLKVSASKSGSVVGNSNGGNEQQVSNSITVYHPKKGDTITVTKSASGLISKNSYATVSYNGGAPIQIGSQNATTTYTVTTTCDYLTITVKAEISNWSNGTTGSASASATCTYNGSYENFVAN